jgi:hypothetical protein
MDPVQYLVLCLQLVEVVALVIRIPQVQVAMEVAVVVARIRHQVVVELSDRAMEAALVVLVQMEVVVVVLERLVFLQVLLLEETEALDCCPLLMGIQLFVPVVVVEVIMKTALWDLEVLEAEAMPDHTTHRRQEVPAHPTLEAVVVAVLVEAEALVRTEEMEAQE